MRRVHVVPIFVVALLGFSRPSWAIASTSPASPVIANGFVYVNSGYGRLIGHHGNALLAFSVGD